MRKDNSVDKAYFSGDHWRWKANQIINLQMKECVSEVEFCLYFTLPSGDIIFQVETLCLPSNS